MPEFDSTVEYRDVPGFPGYKVGNDGTIWSAWTRSGGGGKWIIGQSWRAMSLHPRKNHGYVPVTFCGFWGRRAKLVHDLVLLAFVGPCPKGWECRHLDGTRCNNRLENICWGTKQENYADMVRHGRAHLPPPATKLTAQDIEAIRNSEEDGDELAKRFGISAGHATKLRRGFRQETRPKKLTVAQVETIAQKRREGQSCSRLGKEYGVSTALISYLTCYGEKTARKKVNGQWEGRPPSNRRYAAG